MIAKILSVKLRLLTPTFIGDSEKNAELLNEKALKGALRFWWRAFLSNPEWDAATLLNKESEIFGGQNKRSKFSINIVERNETLNAAELNITNHYGLRYLFFSKQTRKENSNNYILKQQTYIEPSSSYAVNFCFFDDSAIEPVIKSLLFFEKFGGIGSRSRRGAGSFKIEDLVYDDNSLGDILSSLAGFFKIESGTAYEKNLENMIDELSPIRSKYQNLPLYTSYSKKYSRIKVKIDNFKNWVEALNSAGEQMMNYRKSDILNSSINFHSEAVALHTFSIGDPYSGPDPLTKTAFGLPIIYNFKEKDPNNPNRFRISNYKVTAKGPSKDEDRRASPLFIKIDKYEDSYFIVFLVLWSKFLDDNKKIKLERSKDRATFNISQPNESAIEDFINQL